MRTDSGSGGDVDSSPSSSAGVENGWSCTSAAPVCLHNVDMANLIVQPFHDLQCEPFKFPLKTKINLLCASKDEVRTSQRTLCFH